jgi:hypothetical protein
MRELTTFELSVVPQRTEKLATSLHSGEQKLADDCGGPDGLTRTSTVKFNIVLMTNDDYDA